ncbi:nucleolar complex-associated protein 3 [Bombardia bombarda]|uniref:Nucleolar complex-associated protein 3 n=1 Tax=Bombardia bombarda TaxID=252184 RepID=A0AA39XBB5_9PEZI|nr:nucleolar complex-associated protein 3 [Bombardia bombarda]
MASHPSKRRRLTPPLSEAGQESAPSDAKVQKAFFKSASSWSLENDYESRPRKGKNKKDKKRDPAEEVSGKLPVKTAQGSWVVQDDDTRSIASDEDWLEGNGDNEVLPDEPPAPIPEAPRISEREQIRRAQEELAQIATKLNEDPEEHPGAFKAMAAVGENRLVAIQKLCLVTQMAVYKDLIPGYRIRPATDDAKEKLSKDVKRVRVYEQSLVSGYQEYLKTLAKYASARPVGYDRPGNKISSIAITCACTLLNSVPHFNFRTDLLKILVRKLSTRVMDIEFVKCLKAMEKLFQDDEEGRPSMEAASLLSKMMRAREYSVDESVLNLFLHLRLLSEFSGKASHDSVTRPTEAPVSKKNKEKVFRTKKERKMLKEQKAAEKVMAVADASVSHEERDYMQSETLKMVFATYFRILKARVPNLMGAVLEGLAKYAHLINQQFFGDLLEALKDLIRYSDAVLDEDEEEEDEDDDEDDGLENVRDTSREALLCTVTAFALLAGQDAHNARSDLHLDLSFFITNLFRCLFSLSVNPDLELGAKSLHLQDPDSAFANGRRNFRVNLQTTTVLLMRCLSGVLLPPWNIRSVPPLRLAAFTKQLMSATLHMPEKSSQAVLGLLHDVMHTHGKKINSMWNTEERKGDGTFKPLSETVEGSNPFTATVWEGELLRKHYCPKVKEGLKLLEKKVKAA